jgi:hypothetical protein
LVWPYAISANGKVIAGAQEVFTANGQGPEVWRWTESGGMEILGVPPPSLSDGNRYNNLDNFLMSEDGSTVAISCQCSFDESKEYQFIWRRDTGFVELPLSIYQTPFRVQGLSRDGRVAVGWFDPGTGNNAAFWTQADGLRNILPAGFYPEIVFVSADGQVVGGAAIQAVFGQPRVFYRWTLAGGLEWLGSMPAFEANYPDALIFSSTGPFASALHDDFSPDADGWTFGSCLVSMDGSVLAGTAAPGADLPVECWLATYRPVIERVTQGGAAPGSGDVTVAIYGVGFAPGATAFIGANSLVTTFVGPTRLDAIIPGTSLAGVAEFATFQMTVVVPGGGTSESFALREQAFASRGLVLDPDTGTSKSFAFPFVNSTLNAIVGTVESQIASNGVAVSAEVLPASPASAGLSATLDNTSGTNSATVTVAAYTQNPTPTPGFNAGGGYVDLQVSGADPGDSLTASFYYPSGLDAAAKAALVLMYYNGANWITVQSSGPSAPIKDLANNRFVVVFDSTSIPAITDLKGTAFGLADGAPAIVSPGAPANPLPVGSTVNLAITYTASSASTVAVVWGDGGTSTASLSGSGAASASHTYASAGVYTVVLQITDQQQRRTEYAYRYVVIYDPSAGFVTGGGWINSPAGAYVANPALTGKVTFGFVSKYQKGMTVPTGQTEFQFQTAGFRFNSSAYDWLVVSGSQAQYKGAGTVNGTGTFSFLLTASDGQATGGGGMNKFRIKIWNQATGAVVYDNVPGASDDINSANPQAIAGGSIAIH